MVVGLQMPGRVGVQTGQELAVKVVERSEKETAEEDVDEKLGEEIPEAMDVSQQYQQQEHLLHSG